MNTDFVGCAIHNVLYNMTSNSIPEYDDLLGFPLTRTHVEVEEKFPEVNNRGDTACRKMEKQAW